MNKQEHRATAVAAARGARRCAEVPPRPSPDRLAVSRYSFSGSADHRVILRVAFTQFGRGTGEVGRKAAGLNDRDLDAARPDLLDSDSEKPSTPNFAGA